MTGWILRLLLVLIVAAVAAVASVPLTIITDRAAARVPGLGWTQVQGTIWSGRISGLHVGAQAIGDTELNLRPISLIAGELSYDVRISGDALRGRGKVFATPSALGLRELDLLAEASGLVSLNDAVRAAGGSAQLRGGELLMEGLACRSGAGRIDTDTLVALGASYGESLPRLSGDLSCGDGMILLGLSGATDDSISVDIDGRFGLVEPSRLVASVEGASGEVALALDQLGFSRQEGRLVYIHERRLVGGSQ